MGKWLTELQRSQRLLTVLHTDNHLRSKCFIMYKEVSWTEQHWAGILCYRLGDKIKFPFKQLLTFTLHQNLHLFWKHNKNTDDCFSVRTLLHITQNFNVELIKKFQLLSKQIKKNLSHTEETDADHSCYISDCTLLADSRQYAYKRVLSWSPALAELCRRKFTIWTSQ